MSLQAHLILRLVAVAFLVLAGALVYIVTDTASEIDSEVRATDARVVYQLERMHRGGNGMAPRTAAELVRETSIELVSVMASGTCIILSSGDGTVSGHRLCAGWNAFGEIPPRWFQHLSRAILGDTRTMIHEVPIIGQPSYRLETGFDPVAASTRLWQQAKIAGGLAIALTSVLALLSATAIGHALRPMRGIVEALRSVERGRSVHLPSRLQAQEFRLIAEAVDDLAMRLEQAAAERARLMRRLFEVEEEERRALARDLHDEFGQCLTAAGALAASIRAAAENSPQIAADANSLSKIHARMMATLRGAFSRLRPPELAGAGLKASLRTLVRDWNDNLAGRTRFTLTCEADLTRLSEAGATALYRIVQEALTNSARHASPCLVHITIDEEAGENADGPSWIVARVEDDGKGRVDLSATGQGFGLLGIRERLTALGGSFDIANTAQGVRLTVRLPVGRKEGPQ